jgi:hypothetical protein
MIRPTRDKDFVDGFTPIAPSSSNERDRITDLSQETFFAGRFDRIGTGCWVGIHLRDNYRMSIAGKILAAISFAAGRGNLDSHVAPHHSHRPQVGRPPS